MTERLTTLAAVKDWLGIDTSDSDELLTRIIDAASQFALNYMNRGGFASQTFTENFRGNGKSSMLLRNWPVISVSSVGIGGSLVQASTLVQGGLPSEGYTVSDARDAPQSLELYGYHFYYRVPCQIIYQAGYRTSQAYVLELSDEPDTVTVTPSNGGQWVADVGVTINSLTAVKVTADPSTGQYSVDESGVYTFSNNDATKTAVITYAYCPPDVSFGVTEIIGEWYKRRDRIGVLSKSLSGGVGESVSFVNSDMNDAVRGYLQPYRNVIPV